MILIVDACAPALACVPDDLVHLVLALGTAQPHVWTKGRQPVLQFMDRFLDPDLEAWQILLALADHLDKNDNLLVILVEGLVAFDHPVSEAFEP